MSLKIPINLKEYGWSETMVNSLEDENLQAICALEYNSLIVYDKALESREDYMDQLFEKVSQEYSIKNIDNVFSKPSVMAGFSFPKLFGNKWLIGAVAIAGAAILLGGRR